MTISTKRHLEVLETVREFYGMFDRSPRIKDVAKNAGIPGTSVSYYVRILEDQGLVRRDGRKIILISEEELQQMSESVQRLETRGQSLEHTGKLKSAAGTAGAKKLMENARKVGAFISGVSRLPAADDRAVLARIEMLGQREDAVKNGSASGRDVVMQDRCHVRMRVSGARKLG